MQYYVKLAKEKVAELLVSKTQAGDPGKDFYSIFRDDYDEILASRVNSEFKRRNNGKGKGKAGKVDDVFLPAASANPSERDLLGPKFDKDPRTQKGYTPPAFEYDIPLDVVKAMIEKKSKFDALLA